VALYVADLARRGRRPATIARKLAAIAVYHRSLDHPTPTDHDVVRAVVRGTRRQLGVAQPQKTALELDALRSVVLAIPDDDLRGRRDRALLLVGWAAALRRSELVALEVADLSFELEGVVLTIRRSKTDRDGAGAAVAVPFGEEVATCPVAALRRWLAAAAIDTAAGLRPRRSTQVASFAESIATAISGRPYRIGRWPRSWRPAPLPPASTATSPGIRCALDSQLRPRGPGARRPRSCATGAGGACRSHAATSAKAPDGTTILPLTSDYSHRGWLAGGCVCTLDVASRISVRGCL
jgi:integrase